MYVVMYLLKIFSLYYVKYFNFEVNPLSLSMQQTFKIYTTVHKIFLEVEYT